MAAKAIVMAAYGALLANGVGVENPEDYVDVLIGTRSRIDLSTGNVLPFLGRPWGMNLWAPQTNNYSPSATNGKAWWFHPDDKELYGIRCTHQPSPWINDYGNFLIQADMGIRKTKYPDKTSFHKPEKLSPYQMDFVLTNHCTGDGECITMNMTATKRGAIFKISFPSFDESAERLGYDQTRRIRVLLSSNLTDYVSVDPATGEMSGYTTKNSGGVPVSSGPPLRDDSKDTCKDDSVVKPTVGLHGHDIYRFRVNGTGDAAAQVCLEQCCSEENCVAWTLDPPSEGLTEAKHLYSTPSGLRDCDSAHSCCWIKDVAEDDGARGGHISGWKKGHGPETTKIHFKHYFVMQASIEAENGDTDVVNDNMFVNGLEGYLEFPALTKSITLRVATSFISLDQAKTTLELELPKEKRFEDIADESRDAWRSLLSHVKVEGGGAGDPRGDFGRLQIFYSSMYRASLFPRSLAEVTKDGKLVHYSPYDSKGRVFPGEISTDSGFWDAYRTVYQYGALVNPDQYSKIIQGWINAYRENGWIPSWPSPGERGAMAATMQDAVIADAIVRKTPGINLTEAYEAIRKDAFEIPPPLSKRGRASLAEYVKYGYIPADSAYHDGVAATLNFKLADFSVSLAAEAMNFPDEAKKLRDRASSWKLLFDAHAPGIPGGIPGFFRVKFTNGSFPDRWDPFAWGGDYSEYTEASGYQYRFYVPHDPKGLADAYGGTEKICKAIEEMMTAPPVIHVGTWGLHHEQVELINNCFGEYEHNNQPVHHVLYMAKGAGCPSVGQKWLRIAQEKLYNQEVGFSGDEDNGEMASWFVLSALGLYQLVPGASYYEIGSPLFETAVIDVPGGKKIEIVAKGNSRGTPYIKSVVFNGKKLTNLRVSIEDLKKGGLLEFEMSGDPKDAEEFLVL